MMKSAVTLGLVGMAVATPASIFAILEGQATLSTLEAVLNQSGGDNQACFGELKTALSSAGTLTAFAPNNDAWAEFQTDTGIDCTDNANAAACCDVIRYHVLGQAVDFDADTKTKAYTTLNTNDANLGANIGQNLFASVVGDVFNLKYGLKSSSVSTKNVAASNGFANIIDSVLYPLPEKVTKTATAASLNTLLSLVETIMGLTDTLDDTESLTVFAPNDAAFDKISTAGLSTADLTKILQTHVVAGAVAFSTDLPVVDVQTLLTGQTISVSAAGVALGSDVATLNTVDVSTTNGVVHVIDSVLIPAEVRADNTIPANLALLEDTSRFYEIVTSDAIYNPVIAALADDTVEKTVFAPNNAAFDKFEVNGLNCETGTADVKQACLSAFYYHVAQGNALSSGLSGGDLFSSFANNMTSPDSVNLVDFQMLKIDITGGVVKVNDATVTKVDYVTKSGIIHVIDTVLSFPGTASAVATASGVTDTLVKVLTNTELVSTVDTAPSITIFAPTDTAFAALEKDMETTYNKCLSDVQAELDECAAILKYHVLATGTIYAKNIATGETSDIVTLNGETITITNTDGAVTITDGSGAESKVTATDILIGNGVIHLIDSVLLPASAAAAQVTAAAVAVVAMVSALLA